jgi:hypothetical protein
MIELDPIDALALTLHHSPGTQALLLGSGISRSAGIPTGWEITLDLIRRLASVQGIVDQPDWSAWYRKRYSKDPSYSEILDSVATTPAERRSIIHSYIDAREDDETRHPTKAHHAVAKLVALGAVRVILTTNFDRLLESALQHVGVEPTVIASDDALIGATPLVHSRCTIIKLHGDYMDTRIRNTEDELECYSSAMSALMDRVLDEYGLLVAGWSGEWDTALRNAILRGTSRRYPFYWATRGNISALGRDLVAHRGGREIAIADADSFFSQLIDKIQALQFADRAHPQSVALKVAQGKRICQETGRAADWSDMLAREVEQIASFVSGQDYPQEAPTNSSINALTNATVGRSETLRRLVLVGVRWGADETFQTTLRAISALTFPGIHTSGFTWWSSLRQLSASLCFHWAVAAALMRDDYQRVASILHMSVRTRNDQIAPAVRVLPLTTLDSIDWKVLSGLEQSSLPHVQFFPPIFVSDARDIVVGMEEAERAWDDAEFVIAMEFAYLRNVQMQSENGLWFWTPLGRFLWSRHGMSLNDRLDHVRGLSPQSKELKAGLFGASSASAKVAAESMADFRNKVAGSIY